MKYLRRKLKQKRIWKRIFVERLTEPLHLNIISLFFWLFGSYRKKIAYDLIVRPQHAFSILKIADQALKHNIRIVTLLEFGVANGAGLMNIAEIARKITKITGVEFKIYGFDTGYGMPKPTSYKDHPEYYLEGDFKMDFDILRNNLPENVSLILGKVEDTLPEFQTNLKSSEPIGFISFDLDYYSSTKTALKILEIDPQFFTPLPYIYFDDIILPNHNNYCGELLAIQEFNNENRYRKIEYHRFLENERIFRKARWIKQIFYFHILDHEIRNNLSPKALKNSILNPYLKYNDNKETWR